MKTEQGWCNLKKKQRTTCVDMSFNNNESKHWHNWQTYSSHSTSFTLRKWIRSTWFYRKQNSAFLFSPKVDIFMNFMCSSHDSMKNFHFLYVSVWLRNKTKLDSPYLTIPSQNSELTTFLSTHPRYPAMHKHGSPPLYKDSAFRFLWDAKWKKYYINKESESSNQSTDVKLHSQIQPT